MFNGQIYSGMLVGGSHHWVYPNGQWYETKVAPHKWEFSFESIKKRNHLSKDNTGAAKSTTFHWYIIADQKATKLDSNSYITKMSGYKFKLGHRRAHWRKFSYDYEDQPSYNERIMQVLMEILNERKRDNND